MRIIVSVLAVLGIIAAGSALAQGRSGSGGAHRGGGHGPGGARPPGGVYAPGAAHYYGGHHYRGYRHGGVYYPYYRFWGGLGLGLGLGWAGAHYGGWPGYGYYYGPPTPSAEYGVLANSGWTVSTAPSAEPAPAPAAAPDLIFYPRNGQGDEKKEADLRECNRWATTQPAAMSDANIFMRAVLACMEGRGYTGR